MREFARVSSAARLPLTAGTDALAPRAPTPNAGAARVLGRAPRPRTSAPRRAHDRPYGIPRRHPPLGDTGPVAVDVSVPLPGADPGRFLRSEPDEALVELVCAGHEAAFEAIYDRHHRGLLAFCRHMVGSREEGEDALQHTFAAAYRALTGGGERPRLLKPWLYAIARNRCILVLRARRPDEAAPACDEESDAPVVDGLADAVQRRDDLRNLVADIHRLPDEQRAAIVLFELGDHSHAEIAAVLSIDRAKVKALVFQAREGLLRARTARDTPCAEIRSSLSSRTRVLPRRGVVRGHLDRCAACAAYDLEVRRQRSALALALPVLPSLELKDSVLGPLIGGGAGVAGGGAVGAGRAARGGGGAGARPCRRGGGGGGGAGAGAAGGGGAGGAGASGAGAAGAGATGAGAAAAGAGGATGTGAGAAAGGATARGAAAAGAAGTGAAAAGASGGLAGIGAAGGFAGVGAAGGLGAALAAKAVVAKVVTIVAVAGAAAGAHHAA